MNIQIRRNRLWEKVCFAGTKDCACWLAKQVGAFIAGDYNRDRMGLYLAVGDAAVDTSISFWKAAITDGVDFVNPRDFHWTLASSLAAHAAIEAGLRGPVQTLIGESESMIAALSHGIADLKRDTVERALVGGLNFNGCYPQSEQSRAAFIILEYTDQPGIAEIEKVTENTNILPEADTLDPLVRICLAIQAGNDTVIGAPGEQTYIIRVRGDK